MSGTYILMIFRCMCLLKHGITLSFLLQLEAVQKLCIILCLFSGFYFLHILIVYVVKTGKSHCCT